MKKLFKLFIVTTIIVLPDLVVPGEASFLPLSGAESVARGGLILAGSSGSVGDMLNPASLMKLSGKGFQAAIIDRRAQNSFDDENRGLFRSYRNDDFSFSGGFYWVFGSTVGAAVTYRDFIDYNLEWPYALFRRKPGSTVIRTTNLESRIHIQAVSPSFSVKLRNLSFGLSANIQKFEQKKNFLLANDAWYSGKGLAAYDFSYDLEKWIVGLSAGFIADVNDRFRIGGYFKSPAGVSLSGTAESNMFADLDSAASKVDLNSGYELPLMLGLGIAFNLSEKIELNVDGIASFWSGTQGSQQYQFADPAWQTGLAKVDTVTGIRGGEFDHYFSNAFDIGAGLEYSTLKKFSYRLGYRFSRSANSPESFSLFYPEVDKHYFSVGVGYTTGQLEIDTALSYSLGVQKTISFKENQNYQGTFDADVLIPAISFRYKL